MTAIPNIPGTVCTIEQLDAWIEQAAPTADNLAARLRMMVAVMDRAAEIGAKARVTR